MVEEQTAEEQNLQVNLPGESAFKNKSNVVDKEKVEISNQGSKTNDGDNENYEKALVGKNVEIDDVFIFLFDRVWLKEGWELMRKVSYAAVIVVAFVNAAELVVVMLARLIVIVKQFVTLVLFFK